MLHGLKKATNYYNKLEAWKDWQTMLATAQTLGLEEQALALMPQENWSWRRIDKQTAKLNELISKVRENQKEN